MPTSAELGKKNVGSGRLRALWVGLFRFPDE